MTAAEHFKDDPRIELAAVDCTKFSAICSSYSVRGYPTIKYFNYLKTMRDYQGGRTVLNFIVTTFRKFQYWSICSQSADFIKFLSDPDAPEDIPAPEPFGTYPGSDNVLILSDSEFDVKIKSYKRALVMFYAPCMYSET